MLLKVLLCFSYVLICMRTGICSYMGSETVLRWNIADLLYGKLKLSDETLPYDKCELIDTTPKDQSGYDFIVIGAGSAGAAIASRLSETPNVSVLIIEAGGKEYSIFDVPALALALQPKSEFSWNYKSEKSDKYCLSEKDRKCKLPSGKVMGGGSTINSFLATRGSPRDYDQWADMAGDDTWSYDNMLKCLKKLEHFGANGIRFNNKYRNQVGPVRITVSPDRLEITKDFIEAGVEMGYSEVDHNGPEEIGFSYYQNTMFGGERWSSNRGYLRSVKHRKNLICTQHSHVLKILIDKESKRAYGVRYAKGGKIYEVKARKEIILSAGGFNSPQILMLSGIGPEKHLRELNIDVIKDAPVGENLLDHILYRQLMFAVNDSSTVEVPNVLDPADSSIKNYVNYRSGALAYGSILQAVSFMNLNNRSDTQPNMRIAFYPGDVWVTKESVTSDKEPVKAYGIQPMLLRPKSRGKVLLRSKNPFDKPKIYPNYLEDPEDVKVLIEGIRLSMKIAETDALKKHGSVYQQPASDCDVHGVGSDKYWECELRHNARSVYHYGGTCRMGRENCNSSVVHSKLKVIGVSGLRVADSSIMPDSISGHVNIPVIAIGEKAAELIKEEYGY